MNWVMHPGAMGLIVRISVAGHGAQRPGDRSTAASPPNLVVPAVTFDPPAANQGAQPWHSNAEPSLWPVNRTGVAVVIRRPARPAKGIYDIDAPIMPHGAANLNERI